MNWATYLIGTDSGVQKKVHEELDSIFGNDVCLLMKLGVLLLNIMTLL